MRTLILTLALIFSLGFTAQAGTLHDNMKEMGKIFKLINRTIRDSSANQDNIVRVQNLKALLSESFDQLPDTIAEMPEVQQAEAFQLYQNLMQQSLDLSQQLEDALVNGDNDAALEVFNALSEVMDEGHDHFEPQE